MKRMIKVLLVAVLMAVILVASISPAMARRVPGGVLLSTTQPCLANTQNPRLVLNPPGRAPGCWFLLPPGAANNPPITIDSGGVVL
ncbi:MAG TPA: hypothetical protein VI055_05565 [Rubrobacter sp.]|jgi:hypothetical protein